MTLNRFCLFFLVLTFFQINTYASENDLNVYRSFLKGLKRSNENIKQVMNDHHAFSRATIQWREILTLSQNKPKTVKLVRKEIEKNEIILKEINVAWRKQLEWRKRAFEIIENLAKNNPKIRELEKKRRLARK